ncbi:MAG: energy-coupling factor transporter ATPase [Candidatus Coatesbacteria bacterium]
MTDAVPRIEFRGVSFAYPARPGGALPAPEPAETPALRDVSFALPAGVLAVVGGRNGAGKSTLALAANGTIPHLVRGTWGGEVLVNGVPPGTPRDRAHEIGVVFQDFEAHLVSSTVELEVAFPLENAGLDPAMQRERVRETLALVGLAGFEGRVPAELSGGEKQRLAIAAAIALEPAVLVLDEPLTDLDPLGKSQVLAVVGRLKAMGMTVLLVEHDPQAFLGADRLLVLDAGRLVFDGAPGALLRDPTRCRDLGLPAWPPAEVALALGVPVEDPAIDAVAAAIQARRPANPVSAGLAKGTILLSSSPLLEFAGLTSGYSGGAIVLHDISLSVRAGECVALLGQNGSGKTALAKHAVGLIRPRAGSLTVKGRPVRSWKLAELSRIVGYVFQNPDHQIFSDTVRDEISFGARNLGLAGAELEARVKESLEAVGLGGREEEDPFSLTKGERQRLAVASLLAYRPEAVIFDEPTTGLDAAEARRMMDFIATLNARGMTVLLITHAMWAAAEYASRIVVMAEGRIVMDGAAHDVFAREAELARLALSPPPAAALANRLGVRALGVAELAGVLEGRAP